MSIQPNLGTVLRVTWGLALLALLGCAEGPGDREPAAAAQPDGALPSVILADLLDFDADAVPAWVEPDGAAVKLVPAPETDDGSALEIAFSPESSPSAVRLRPPQPWDWSAYSDFHLAFDARNLGEESVQLRVSVTDANGATTYRGTNIAAGEANTYFAVLDGPFLEVDSGLRESPPPWDTTEEMLIYRRSAKQLALDAITELTLSVRGTLTEKRVLVDNIRLHRNPEQNPAYLENFVDRFGQNAKLDYPIKIASEEELKQLAEAELAALAASGPLPDRSRFGGWKDGPRLEGTGFFRTEKVNDKWWLVDPEGHLFFSNGLANVRIANLTTFTGIDFRDDAVRYIDPSEVTPEDSIGIVPVSDEIRQTRFVSSPMRRNMFNWLPAYDDALADHYSYRRSALRGPMRSGETYSFYRANLERRYGEDAPESYLRKWEEVTLARMLDWGFTSTGNWVDPAFYPNQQVPYFANGWIIGDFKTLSSAVDVWAPMPDPFDPEFVSRAETTIQIIADEIQASPWCIGVFVDNEKSWGFREGTVAQRYGLILDALSRASSESPAKAAFAEALRGKYESVDALNVAWGVQLNSWEELAGGVELADFTAAALEDLSALLELLSNEYFRVVHDSLQQVLPNHLYMGVRMANWGMPDETIKAAVKYSDVLSFNIYEEGVRPQAWSFLEEIDLPSIIGEWHIGATNETGLYHPGLVHADGQADRAAMYQAYLNSVLDIDTMVGAHWFQYVDSPITGRAFDGENYNVGFVAVTDIPYPEMVAAAKAFNTPLYPTRYGDGGGEGG